MIFYLFIVISVLLFSYGYYTGNKRGKNEELYTHYSHYLDYCKEHDDKRNPLNYFEYIQYYYILKIFMIFMFSLLLHPLVFYGIGWILGFYNSIKKEMDIINE